MKMSEIIGVLGHIEPADTMMWVYIGTKTELMLKTTRFNIFNKVLKRKARRLESKAVSFDIAYLSCLL